MMVVICSSLDVVAQPYYLSQDEFYGESVDSTSGRWVRVYRGNDSLFYITKTISVNSLYFVQAGVSNWFSESNQEREWSIKLSSDAARTWKEVWHQSSLGELPDNTYIEFVDIFYPIPTTVVVHGRIVTEKGQDEHSNPITDTTQFMLRTFDIGRTWIFDTTFFQSNFAPAEIVCIVDCSQISQAVIITTTPDGVIERCVRWNYYYIGQDLIDNFFPVELPDYIKGRRIERVVGHGPGPRGIVIFAEVQGDADTLPSGAYTGDAGQTWQPLPKRYFSVAGSPNKITRFDFVAEPVHIFFGGAEPFDTDESGATMNEEVLRVLVFLNDGNITENELWRKRRPTFNGISHVSFADTVRGMILVPLNRSFGYTYFTRPDGTPDSTENIGFEYMIYRTENRGRTWVREPLAKDFQVGNPAGDMAGEITDVIFRRDPSGTRVRLMMTRRDIFRFEPITTSVAEEPSAQSVVIFPNPAQNTLRLRLSENVPLAEHVVSITIVNTLGKPVLSVQQPVSDILDISMLANGVYFLRATTAEGSAVTRPFVVQR